MIQYKYSQALVLHLWAAAVRTRQTPSAAPAPPRKHIFEDFMFDPVVFSGAESHVYALCVCRRQPRRGNTKYEKAQTMNGRLF